MKFGNNLHREIEFYLVFGEKDKLTNYFRKKFFKKELDYFSLYFGVIHCLPKTDKEGKRLIFRHPSLLLIRHPGLRTRICLGVFGNGEWEMGNGRGRLFAIFVSKDMRRADVRRETAQFRRGAWCDI